MFKYLCFKYKKSINLFVKRRLLGFFIEVFVLIEILFFLAVFILYNRVFCGS